MLQAGYYRDTTYWKAMKNAGTGWRQGHVGTEENEDQRHVHSRAYIRADGVMIQNMYVMQVKIPQESKYPGITTKWSEP